MTGRLLASQRGVALVTAMLLMVIGVLLAARIAWDNQLHVRRATMAADMEQAKLFAMGAEAIAIAAIRADYDDYPQTTSIPTHGMGDGLLIAQELPVGIEDRDFGVMVGKLDDLQGRFNLNNLLEGNGVTGDQLAQDVLKRLLIELRLNDSLLDAIVDWIDPDTQPLQRGAEDGVYTGLNPPYRPANRNFTHVSELRAVAGIGKEEYRLLRRYVTALPVRGCRTSNSGDGPTSININFARPALIVAMDDNLSIAEAEGWAETAEVTGMDLATLDTSSYPNLADLTQAGYVDSVTHCFGLTVHVSIGNSVLSMYSVLERTGNGKDVFVRQRIFGIENPD